MSHYIETLNMPRRRTPGDTVRESLAGYVPDPMPRPRTIEQRIHALYGPNAQRDFSRYARTSEAGLYQQRLKMAREAGMACNGPKGRKATKAKRQPRLIVDAGEVSS